MHLKALLFILTSIPTLTLGAPLSGNPGIVESLHMHHNARTDATDIKRHTDDDDGGKVASVAIMTLEGEAEVERPGEDGW